MLTKEYKNTEFNINRIKTTGLMRMNMKRWVIINKCTIIATVTTVLAMILPVSVIAAGDAAKGKEIAAGICAGCHNPDGNSIIPTNPILAGQHPEYLIKQLMDFKAEEGKSPNRESAIMGPMVASLTQQDMENLAAFYAGQKPESARNVTDNVNLLEMGETLYHGGNIENGVPACASCHGPKGAGIPPHYPAIAGQHAEYTFTQLNLFNESKRINDKGVMHKVVTRMNGEEERAVAEYIQSMDAQ